MERVDLQEQFEKDLFDACRESMKACGYYPGEFLGRATRMGAVEAARRLLHETTPGYYFRSLCDLHRQDLSVEAQVARPEYRTLFTPEEIRTATQRMRAQA
jgi:hypothetical protein